MRSLFAKIFFSFWLAILLMGAVLFLVERSLGQDLVARVNGRLAAHAETFASLVVSQGVAEASAWLRQISRDERFTFLPLDGQRQPLPGWQLPPGLYRLSGEGEVRETGIDWIRPGLAVLVHPVPGVDPPLHLAAVISLHHSARLPQWARIGMAVVISGLVCLALSALVARPVRRLRDAVQAFTRGNLEMQVGMAGDDEVAALGRDFDIMAARMRNLLASQRHLLRDVSHELRSPLARLRVVLELVRCRGMAAEDLNRIELELERLESLITDVLTMARLESGQVERSLREVQLASMLEEIAGDAAFEAQAQDKEVVLAVARPCWVLGDPSLLRAAVENVVRNAIRHTPPSTAVTLALRVERGMALILVQDGGDGVPEEDLQRIFEPFARASVAREREQGGVGLGLSISRQVVTVHQGAIEAENIPDGGLRVTLRLPLVVQTR